MTFIQSLQISSTQMQTKSNCMELNHKKILAIIIIAFVCELGFLSFSLHMDWASELESGSLKIWSAVLGRAVRRALLHPFDFPVFPSKKSCMMRYLRHASPQFLVCRIPDSSRSVPVY